MKILAPCVAILFLAACASRGQPEAGASGAEIFTVSGCIACHGGDRSGSGLGPSLLNLKEHWQAADLAAYFVAPGEWIQREERLQKLDAAYGASMPDFGNLNLSERERLARYLITPN